MLPQHQPACNTAATKERTSSQSSCILCHSLDCRPSTAMSTPDAQVENFDAEIEQLGTMKKKAKPPPRAGHLEESVTRHKAHITRLEQMLRLLDNEQLNPEDIEEVKDMVDDYLERNQESFSEFETPDDLYAGLIEQLDSLEVLQGPLEHRLTMHPDRVRAGSALLFGAMHIDPHCPCTRLSLAGQPPVSCAQVSHLAASLVVLDCCIAYIGFILSCRPSCQLQQSRT